MSDRLRDARVLVVSHDPAMRSSISDMLEGSNYKLTFAENGREALGMLRDSTPGAIVLDYTTPLEGKGSARAEAESLEKITDEFPLIPLVLLCMPSVNLSRSRFLMADMVLRLPVVAPELNRALETVLTETVVDRAFRKAADVAALK